MDNADAKPAQTGTVTEAATLGLRLREAREQSGLGVRELGKRVDVSGSMISQIERGKVMPSVATLYAIVKQLGISMDELFSGSWPPAASNGPVQWASARETIYLASGVRWERLTSEPDPKLEFQCSTYAPGSESCPPDELMSHEGWEYGFVLTGRLWVTIGDKTYALGPGDAISFSSLEPHRLANNGSEAAEALWVVLGRDNDNRPERLTVG